MNDDIESIMNNFDFQKVYRVMGYLGWRWINSGSRTPSIEKLRACARQLLEEVYNKPLDYYYLGTSGFKATKWNGVLGLEFILTDWDCE